MNIINNFISFYENHYVKFLMHIIESTIVVLSLIFLFFKFLFKLNYYKLNKKKLLR